MSNQLFKEKIPIKMFIDFLEKVISPDVSGTDKEIYIYKLDKITFKKFIYLDEYKEFLNKIVGYYFTSKRHYVEKTQTYNSFLTICRQICKSHNIEYTSKILYDKSKYEIIYYLNICKSKFIDLL